MRQWAQRVGEGLLALPEVSEARLISAPDYEVAIEVAPRQLWRYGLTLDEVAEAVAKASLDLPGGEVKTSAGEILLRHAEQAYSREDFEAIVLRAGEEGARLTLGQRWPRSSRAKDHVSLRWGAVHLHRCVPQRADSGHGGGRA